MHRHQHFDLLLHDDAELEALLQTRITQRATLHEWPLSCVQRITTADDREVIYKSQSGPFVEAEFYASASSKLLVSAETVWQSGRHVCMLLEYIRAPLLKDLGLTEEETLRIGRAVISQIGKIEGALPVYVDLSTEEKWEGRMHDTLTGIRTLVDGGDFRVIDNGLIRRLERTAFSHAVGSALSTNPGYVHGDLAGDNLFVLPQSYRVIDWQKTKRGPQDLDLAELLESSGFDPRDHVDEPIVWMMNLLRIHWLTECALHWFPHGRKGYDSSIARLIALIGED